MTARRAAPPRGGEKGWGGVMVRLVYTGDHFYLESGSVMSPIYTEDGRRYDWGFVQRDLRAGNEITIRQATDAERVEAERQLRELKKRRAKVATP